MGRYRSGIARGAFMGLGVSAAAALAATPQRVLAQASPSPSPAEPCDPIMCPNGLPFATLNDRRPITTRPTVHDLVANPALLKKYQNAFQAMIDFGTAYPTDPRGWTMQQAIHGEWVQKYSDSTQNIHHGWHFMTWHRAYLYFLERILAWHAAGSSGTAIDPTLRLPVWNWDYDEADVHFPAAYAQPWFDQANGVLNPIWVAQRDIGVPLNLVAKKVDMQVMLAAPNSGPGGFYGQSPIPGPTSRNRQGAGENKAHNIVHNWVGGGYNPGQQNGGKGWMGDLATSAKDPVFFAHHANVDKTWAWYRSFKYSEEPPDAGFRDAGWTFFDEQRRCIAVQAKDLYDYQNVLRYRYQPVPAKYFGPPPPNTGKPLTAAAARLTAVAPTVSVGMVLTDVPYHGSGSFDIFAKGPSGSQLLGSFAITPHRGMAMGTSTDVFVLVSPAARALLAQPTTRIVVQREGTRGGLLTATAGATELSRTKATLFVH